MAGKGVVPVSFVLTSVADCQVLGRLRASVDRRCLYSSWSCAWPSKFIQWWLGLPGLKISQYPKHGHVKHYSWA